MNIRTLATIAILTASQAAWAVDTGLNPLPTFTSISATSSAEYDAPNTCYYYHYSVTNPSSNTGAVQFIKINMATAYNYFDPGACQIPLSIPRPSGNWFFDPNFSLPLSVAHGGHVLPFGAVVPDGWVGTADAVGMSGFATTGPSARIQPGQTVSGFTIQTSTPPTLKQLVARPHWVYEVSDEAGSADTVAVGQMHAALMASTTVLGPSSVVSGTEDHWNQFKNDIASLIQMGWISNASFGTTVQNQLAAARSINDSQGSAYVTPSLNTLLATINASTPAQRNDAAFELLQLNVQALLMAANPPNSQPPTPLSVPKAMIITADKQTLALNTSITVVAQVVDTANNNAPIVNQHLNFFISGVNGASAGGVTDANGMFSFTYTGMNEGTDQVLLHMHGELNEDSIYVNWKGGPDLVVKRFIPPILQWNGTGHIHITEDTQNIGTTAATASVTRYYFSDTSPVDPTTAQVAGQRSVPALAPGSDSSNGGVDITLPSGTASGVYYMTACADADNQVGELDETNNCESTEIAVPVQNDNPTQPPVCSAATPSQTLLWPPNHKFQTVTVQGVTDPNNLTPTITITGIQQDEPVNAAGDGNTAPDGQGVGTSTAQVRSERSGIAVGGRLYFISFKASDTAGGSCTGTVTVGVPHDQGQHAMPTDNGQRYDSTANQ